MKSDHLPRHLALLLFAVVVLAWGFNWPVTKLMVQSISPLWTAALRSLIAAVVLLGLLLSQGNFVVPRRGDLPVVFGITLPHMVAFSGLVAIGIQFVPAGRAIVLGYTTPLWVIPAARLFLGEPITRYHLAGGAVAFAGLAIMFNPASFDWSDGRALLGNVCFCSLPPAGPSASSMSAPTDGYRRRSNSSSGRRCWPPACSH
jgi:drug/metabolite transporter (DMT)-like permease